MARWAFKLPRPARLGGFSFTATWNPEDFTLGEPVPGDGLKGYMCQANVRQPGVLRWSCVGLVQEDRGGVLATFDVHYRDAPPTLASFQVTQNELVDDFGRGLPGLGLELAAAP